MSVPRVWCQPSNMLCKESVLLKAKGCAQYLQNLQPGISQCYTHSPLSRQLHRIFPRPGLWWQLKHSARVALRLSTVFILSSQVIINLRSISYMTRDWDWQNSCNKLITIELGWSYLEPVKNLFCTLIDCANCPALPLHCTKSLGLLLLSRWQEFEKLQYHDACVYFNYSQQCYKVMS